VRQESLAFVDTILTDKTGTLTVSVPPFIRVMTGLVVAVTCLSALLSVRFKLS
jgi:cation transport ATPase